jgi:hypothetical protein
VTDLEKRAVTALRSVRMPEVNWHARRADSLNVLMMVDPDKRLSVDQKADLWFLVWRYRRQIDDCDLVATAKSMVTGAMSLAF